MSTFIQKVIAGIEGCSETSDSVSKKDLSSYMRVLEIHSIVIEKTKRMIRDVYEKKKSISILNLVPQYNCHVIASTYVDILNSENHDVILTHGVVPGISDDRKSKYCKHSWITTKDNSIIESWPTGALFACPLIYPKGSYRSPFGANLYIPNETNEDSILLDPAIIKRIKLLKDLILS